MSTTIFTGFRIPMTEMYEFSQFIDSARKLLYNKWIEDYLRDIARSATRVYDSHLLDMNLIDSNSSPITPFKHIMFKEFRAKSDDRDTLWARNETYLYLIPQPDYLIGLTNQTWAFDTLIESNLGVEEFGYWNNTDKPDNLTEEEWEFRKQVWDNLVGYGEINQYALNVLISPAYPPVIYENQLDPYIPDFDSRAAEVAKIYKGSKIPKEVIEECRTDSFVPYMEWMHSNEAQERYKEGLAMAKNTIPETLTGSDLNNKWIYKND